MSIDWFRRTVTVLTVAPTTIYALSTEWGSMLLLHLLHIVGLLEFINAAKHIVNYKTKTFVLCCGITSAVSTVYGVYAFGRLYLLLKECSLDNEIELNLQNCL
jgi:hypothetical protein